MSASKSARVLVTGGAGYIGAVTAAALFERGHEVVLYDDLSQADWPALPAEIERVEGDVLDIDKLKRLCDERGFEGVIHFAALIQVGESVLEPARYWRINVGGTASVVEAFRGAGGTAFVYSSSAAVYGNPMRLPIDEDQPHAPTSPYGATKSAGERLLTDAVGSGLRSAALRYFNAAGSSREGTLGERHHPESHLIPLAFDAIRTGQALTIYGDDWPTKDGTCLRDYVHVEDLALAHVLALEWLLEGPASRPALFRAFNVGSGSGHTVREVLSTIERVVGQPVPARVGPRRAGDPPGLVASNDRLRAELGWAPAKGDLATIIKDAWKFVRASSV